MKLANKFFGILFGIIGMMTLTGAAFGATQYTYPLSEEGEIFGAFSDYHDGIDIVVPAGTPVLASRGGTVETVYTGCHQDAAYGSDHTCASGGLCNPNHGFHGGYCNGGYGDGVIILHDDGSFSAYAHMKDVSVSLGQKVEQGEVLGKVGATGKASGTHLHFEIRDNSDSNFWLCNPINPELLVGYEEVERETGLLNNFVYGAMNLEFTDVAYDSWCRVNVESAVALKLMNGKGEGIFAPEDKLTVGETLALATRVRLKYFLNEDDLREKTDPWYAAYMNYGVDNGLISVGLDPDSYVSREQFAEIFYNSLGDSAFAKLNPYISFEDSTTPSVMTLGKAGIIIGSINELGQRVFLPNNSLTRAEAAAIVTRIVDLDLRVEA